MAIVKYRIPNASDREVLFAWLKRASSYTGWKLLLEKEKVFSAAVERAYKDDQRHPRPDGELVPTRWMSDVFAKEGAFEAALERLRDDDRRCFLYLGAPGHFSQGTSEVVWWQDMDGRNRYMSGPAFTPNRSSFWPEIAKAIDDFMDVFSDLGVVLQTAHTDVPAPIDDIDGFASGTWARFARLVPGDRALAAVPAPPKPEIYVRTREIIPEYGIWEPVDVKGGQVDGPMNYLHGGFAAPTIGFANDDQAQKGRPTLWRLIWIDKRYGSKPIPDEEKSYRFGTK
jgi:hypothetical protein